MQRADAAPGLCQVSLSERLLPVKDAARAYGENRSEVRLVRMVRAIQQACAGIEPDPPAAEDEPPMVPWAAVVVSIAVSEAESACGHQVRLALGAALRSG